MKNDRFLTAVPLLVLLLLVPIRQGMTQDDSAPVAEAPLPQATPNAGGLSLYRTLIANPEFIPDDGNLLLSPTSVESVLHVLRLGAGGRTAAELDRLLLPVIPAEGNPVAPAERPELREGAALWAEEGWPLLPGFTAALAREYQLTAQTARFSDNPGRETEKINAWVRERTAEKISELFAPSDLSGDTRLVIASAMAYEGAWDSPFDEDYTQPGDFRTGRGRKAETDYMRQVGEFATATAADGTRVLALPLQEGRQRCVIVLPPDGGKDPLQALLALERKLTPERYRELTANLAETTVDLKLPRLEMHVRSSLKASLQLSGAGSMFSARTADFTAMSDEPGLCVSVLRHEVTLTLDEKGARGAAATGAAMATRGFAKKPVAVSFDRPFLFAIEEVGTGRILFLGRLVTPLAVSSKEAA